MSKFSTRHISHVGYLISKQQIEILGYESLGYKEILGYVSLCYNEIQCYEIFDKSVLILSNHKLLKQCIYFRFLYCSNLWNSETAEIDKSLSNYFIQQPESGHNSQKLLHHILDMDTHSQQQQFKLLSTISNFQHI